MSFATAEPLDQHIIRKLPRIYRSPHHHQQEWEAVLRQEIGKYFDQAEKGIRGYLAARPAVLKILTIYERDETAQQLLHQYAEGEIRRIRNLLQNGNAVLQGVEATERPTSVVPAALEPEDIALRMDRRSVTRAPEPTMLPGRQTLNISTTVTAPLPVTVSPQAPMTPNTTPGRQNNSPAMPGPSSLRTRANTPVSHGKRPVDGLEPEQRQQHTPPPSKRAKKGSFDHPQPVSTIRVAGEFGWFEVENVEYIFQDVRCGPGWYIIRCNVSLRLPNVNAPACFTQHPLSSPGSLQRKA